MLRILERLRSRTETAQVVALLEEGNTDAAIAVASEASEKHPDDVEAAGYLVLALLQAEHFNEALKAVERLEALSSGNPDAVGTRARILAELKRYHEADTVLRHLLQRHPDHAWAVSLRARVLLWMRRPKEAVRVAERLLDLEPPEGFGRAWANALAELARAFAEEGMDEVGAELMAVAVECGYTPEDVKLARTEYLDDSLVSPDTPLIHPSIASESSLKKRAATLGQASDHAEYANLLLNEHRHAEAHREALKALRTDSANSLAHEVLGQVAAIRRQFVEARQHFTEAAGTNPTPSALSALAAVCELLGDHAAAVRALDAYNALKEANPL